MGNALSCVLRQGWCSAVQCWHSQSRAGENTYRTWKKLPQNGIRVKGLHIKKKLNWKGHGQINDWAFFEIECFLSCCISHPFPVRQFGFSYNVIALYALCLSFICGLQLFEIQLSIVGIFQFEQYDLFRVRGLVAQNRAQRDAELRDSESSYTVDSRGGFLCFFLNP